MNQPGVRPTKIARVQVEGSKLDSEIDVEPLTARFSRVLRSAVDQSGTDAAMLPFAARLGAEKERMITAVPGDVDVL